MVDKDIFNKYIINFNKNLFDELTSSIKYEDITKGRQGAVLIDYKDEQLIPLVRTTTKYNNPLQKFNDIHYHIIEQIKSVTRIKNLEFNNALIEIYDNSYCTMGAHSDQALDLEDDSYICLYSCYENADTHNLRKLKINNKFDSNNISEIILEHNSIVIFSLNCNSKHLHKIVLDSIKSSDRWCGITFRLSKTFIKFINEIPYFVSNNKILHMANEIEKKEFYKYRKIENNSIEYKYPSIDYTISPSDLIFIE